MSGARDGSATIAADVIVAAAGTSQRMAGRDKLAETVAGRPLLAWTLDALSAAEETARIVVVTAPDRVAELSAAPWLPSTVVAVVAGGGTRQESVAAGFRALDEAEGARGHTHDDRPVLVHDGARPLVSPALVSAIARATVAHGAAIPVLPLAETLKRVDGERVSATVDRSGLVTAQTPQGVRRGLLRRAFATASASAIDVTDDAGLLEASGIAVHTVPGEPGNLKVTVPADLARVEAVLTARAATRIGLATDRHAFGPGDPLRLGGIEIAGAARLHGHSDGDAALHAIASSILSAAGLGDLGRLFPADERTRRGADSGELLDEAVRIVGEAGWQVSAVNVAIEAARPRLGGHLDRMCDAIAGHLRISADAVAVTASTGNLSSAEGAGRSISATALATLIRLPVR